MSKKKVPTNWWVYYQGTGQWYESQEAALVAIDLIITSCEHGIWDWQESRIYLDHEKGETVNTDLFDRRYSNKALTPGSSTGNFIINIYVKNKEDWIARYGSELLQQGIIAGYDCDEGYLKERVALDYPGFTASTGTYKKVDTPNEKCLYACLPYKGSHCASNNKDYYIAIDNFLGKYQLRKLIDLSAEIIYLKPSVEPAQIVSVIETTDNSIKEWALEYGSNLLQESIIAGYDCNDRYLEERITYEYPGFEIATRNYPKVDSPNESCLYACLGYEGSYCSSNNKNYYITIDNFLGKYQLVKLIDASREVVEESLRVQAATNTFGIQIRKYHASIINSSRNTRLLLANLTYALIVLFCLYVTRLIFPS
jgi:hypothetical protein